MSELFTEFQEFRRILCVCPCCGDLVRLSDLHLKTKGKIARTWLDDYENKSRLFKKKEDKFGEQEQELRKIARDKGRRAAELAFNKGLSTAISPKFKALKINPSDVKAIFNPIDFVVFNGMTKTKSVDDIMFLSKQVNNPDLNQLRQQVKKAITQKKYEWQVARINERGKIVFE